MDTVRCTMKRIIFSMAILSVSTLTSASQSIVDNAALLGANQGQRITNIESKNKDIMSDYSQYVAVMRQHQKLKKSSLDQHFLQHQKKK